MGVLIMSKNKLRPCPRCGYKGYYEVNGLDETRVACSHCNFATNPYIDRDDAAKEWNRRA
ncbi:MAG: Lar family restriction alleviation protein [Synergistaceae bacterium]|nr:Lar family restriction alleviation protein [Synergistaceae bacterium]